MRKKETSQAEIKNMFLSIEAKKKKNIIVPRNYKESRGLVVPLLCRTKMGCEK